MYAPASLLSWPNVCQPALPSSAFAQTCVSEVFCSHNRTLFNTTVTNGKLYGADISCLLCLAIRRRAVEAIVRLVSLQLGSEAASSGDLSYLCGPDALWLSAILSGEKRETRNERHLLHRSAIEWHACIEPGSRVKRLTAAKARI